ncbi:TrkH family potassium uptake protein [Staphylococcus agnetis]|uniref:TrkH family potassium uptake protein n=1 Tax=Staphylococcus agnetis TaxID=985762 RepID=A0ABD7TU48_9STAP|nr:potassium transporter TrkG [Staphylococcus agnetis]UXU54233.1 TrkH family potassium uptake protein [Staphylococcus agnetis]UXU56487.1 TrkH family potassium uptake protein [Staphylococcus agnetis]
MHSKKQPILIYLTLFLSTTLIGSVLLYLPWSGQKPISFLDAMYVATSAFTVTGLATVDITKQFNLLGDIVIMTLIQIGGMGIVTVSMLALKFTQKSLSVRENILFQLELNTEDARNYTFFLKSILLFNVIFEGIGTFILSFVFVPQYGWDRGIFISLFTSISSLNNAGFALFSDNLISYATNPIVNLTVALLIIFGGLGYIVLLDLVTLKRGRRLQFHSKITIMLTFILITVGAICFWILEMNGVLKSMTLPQQIQASLFQSITTRTAGFNTVDMSHLAPGTMLLMILLMFIGAGPMSAAGGIKVTTFALVIAFVITILKGHQHTQIFNRTIVRKQMEKALAITIAASSFVILIILLISIAQPNLNFEDLAFEVVSAFGTVGLSTGISTEYNSVAKILIILTMIAGKIGVLTLLSVIQTPTRETFHYAKGHVYL